jgi:hypothetical protein
MASMPSNGSMDRGTEERFIYVYIIFIFIFYLLILLISPPPSFVPPPLLDYSLVDDSVAGEDEMLMEGGVVMYAETAFLMDLLVGVALKQELGSGGGNSAYTQQSNRDHGGGELAVATTMRTTMTVLAVAVTTMTMTADDVVGGVVTTR